MNEPRPAHLQPLPKMPTGIEGFDEVSQGGLPRNCTIYSKDDQARRLSSTERDSNLLKMRGADPPAPVATVTLLSPGKRRNTNGSGNSGRKKTRKEVRDAS